MNSIFSFISAFCVGAVVIGALHLLLPEGAMKKPVKYVFSVCFICLIAALFPLSLNIDFSTGAESIKAYTYDVNEAVTMLTVKTALSKAGITYSDVKIFSERDIEGNIVFLTVEVYTLEPESKVKNAIESENIKVSVINE